MSPSVPGRYDRRVSVAEIPVRSGGDDFVGFSGAGARCRLRLRPGSDDGDELNSKGKLDGDKGSGSEGASSSGSDDDSSSGDEDGSSSEPELDEDQAKTIAKAAMNSSVLSMYAKVATE